MTESAHGWNEPGFQLSWLACWIVMTSHFCVASICGMFDLNFAGCAGSSARNHETS